MHNNTNPELVNIYPYAKFYQIPFIQSFTQFLHESRAITLL